MDKLTKIIYYNWLNKLYKITNNLKNKKNILIYRIFKNQM